MSTDRQPVPEPHPLGVAIDLGPQDGFELHVHDTHHQLALPARGVLVMGTAERSWVLSPTRALWIPAGVWHSVAADGPVTMLSAYLEPGRCPVAWTDPTVVGAPPLVAELVARLARTELPGPTRRRTEAVLWDLLTPLPVATLTAPLPTDERARRVADALLADPSDPRTLNQWGRVVGASSRTLARLFATETGMGFERWRTTARLAAALPLLASGTPVATAGRQVGYATASAFVAAFRRELSTTPAAYFRP